ncbi:methylated-DNA--[protein]-cysteine S-methyltransferase [Aliiroseovarius sp. YM-037]|uniref:methylated-DNA--[protein]-cysteine S-methyltransferase n=1 Tax=Aliiroseovarius sp. YM-037 TaxID=3341728 RepID=UPI003A80B076
MPITTVKTPVGTLGVVEESGAITRLLWDAEPEGEVTELLIEAARQLSAYFDDALTDFDLPLNVHGSDLQRKVCAAMSAIPFGETRTYGDIATELGVPAQAIGGACGGNPIPIIIPCHRVLGASSLGGFSGAGGVEMKVALLKHEGAASLLI